jgi:hypothetical protein
MQLLNVPLYGVPGLDQGAFPVMVLETETNGKVRIFQTTHCVAATVDAEKVRRGRTFEVNRDEFRAALIRRAETRRRNGKTVSEKALAEVLRRLRTPKDEVKRILDTPTDPRIVEQRRQAYAATKQNQEIDEALREARKVSAMLAEARAQEAEAEAKAATEAAAAKAQAEGKKLNKYDLVRCLVCRADGASAPELTAATGWKSVAFSRLKDIVVYKKSRDANGDLRYFARRAQG